MQNSHPHQTPDLSDPKDPGLSQPCPTPEEDYSLTAFDRFCIMLNRLQWLTLVVFLGGVVAFFIHRPLAFYLIGASLLYSGLVPILSGSYRGPFGLLLGYKARLRGLVSLVMGIAVVALGYYAQNAV